MAESAQIDRDLGAVQAIITALGPLDGTSRERVLRSVIQLLGLNLQTSGSSQAHNVVPDGGIPPSPPPEDASAFFEKFNHERPSENVKLIAAWLYSQFGVYPITNAEIQELSGEAGITVGTRADSTMDTAACGGKKLFGRKGKGCWQLTLAGEKYIKETYGVRKGAKSRSSDGAQ
ncbi:MAG: hypothetical protein PHU85_09850 [Phycisphaerae bacterium]|nr:hypothetical protein [Phycisphaerae bacterium]